MSQALTFPVPAAGSLDQYIQSVNRMPMLSEQQEVDLATRLRDEGDVDAARKLVMSHLRVVVAIARGYLGYGLPHADLIQEGNIGLMKAVKRFDPDARRALGVVRDPLDQGRDPRIHRQELAPGEDRHHQGPAQAVLQPARHEAGQHHAAARRGAVDRHQLGVKPEEVVRDGDAPVRPRHPARRRQRRRRRALRPHRLPARPARRALRGARAAPARPPAGQKACTTALASLDERSRTIVQRRWLAEGDSATLHELAAEYGVSAERIRQIEAKAMQKMRRAAPFLCLQAYCPAISLRMSAAIRSGFSPCFTYSRSRPWGSNT
jgi:RNA polymerase sigma-32 factor